MAYIYMVKCEDNSIYTGITTDLAKRMRAHTDKSSRDGAKYTKSHRVAQILAVWQTEKYSDAARLEYAIKQLKRADKLMLIEKPSIVGELFERLSEIKFVPMQKSMFENLIEDRK